MTYSELESIAILLYGSHWKQQIIAEFNGKPGMLNNWRRQGVPAYVIVEIRLIADKRLMDVERALRIL